MTAAPLSSGSPHWLRAVSMGLALAVAGTFASCSKASKLPAYNPHQNVLSIAAEFQLFDSQDPYRDEPAEDLTGLNIARATVVRLANYSSLHPGRFEPEVLTLKGRAYERLGDYESARKAFRDAAEFDTPMRDDCRRRATILEDIIRIKRVGSDARTLEQSLVALDQRVKEFNAFGATVEDPMYRSIVRLEGEQAETERAELMAANRWFLAGGEQQVIEAMSSLLSNHNESRRAMEHALRLARFYRELAEEEMRLHPPTGLDFDRRRFTDRLDKAQDLLYRVSQADGRPERLVAARELDAVMALREMVLERAD